MFRSLYAKWMALLFALLLVSSSVLSVLYYQRIREDKFNARISELRIHAMDIAFLAAQASINVSLGMQQYLVWKVERIMREFDAVILIFDNHGGVRPIVDDKVEILNEFMKEETLPLLGRVLQGEEIVVPTIQQQTGNPVFTVGVPFSVNGRVIGAVFIHTSEQNIEAGIQDILHELVRVLLITLLFGAFLVLVVTQLVTRPLRAMSQAAERFARGDFDQLVPIETRDEVGKLAESLNSMAEDLKHLEQTRREFVANVSHELRSPLTSMQGFVTGVVDGTIPEEERDRYLGVVLEEISRMSKLITTLLDLSQMENEKVPLQKSTFDINDMIVRTIIRQESRTNELSLDVQVEFAEDRMEVCADHDRIEQVLVNLLDNAIKHSEEGGTIRFSVKQDAKNHVHVSIEDTGEGIAKEDIPFIFERFYTTNKAHTKGMGTGLGLSIAKKIINQHGYQLTVSSELGKGSRFEFTLDGAY